MIRRAGRKALTVFILSFALAGGVRAGVVFNADGRITYGANSVGLDKDGVLTIETGGIPIKFVRCFFEVDPKTKEERWFSAASLEKKTLAVDVAGKRTVFKGAYLNKETGESLEITLSVSLKEDNNVRFEVAFDNEALFAKGILKKGWLFTDTGYASFIGKKIIIDDREFIIEKGSKVIDQRAAPEKVVLFAGAPAAQTIFHTHTNAIHFMASPDRNNIYLSLPDKFDIELSVGENGPEAKETANYYPTDELYCPNYNLCRNLIQNPSFEAGFRYWQMDGRVNNHPQSENFVVDSGVACKGKKSLRLYGRKGGRIGLGYPATFAIPVESGVEYTLSFYAKADNSQNLSFYTVEGRGVNPFLGETTLNSSVLLTSEWKRYHCPLKPRTKILAIVFHIQYPSNDVTAWIDCVQLEKGGLTEYTEKPVCAELVTDHFDNLFQPGEAMNARFEIQKSRYAPNWLQTILKKFQPGEAMNARLEIHTLPNMKGKAALSLKDFFSKNHYEDTLAFTADETGFALLKLPLDKKRLPTGIYILKTDFTLESGYRDDDYFRMGIMQYSDNKFRHKNIFAALISSSTEGVEERIKRLKHIGIGAVELGYFPVPEPKLQSELNKNDILVLSSIFRRGSYVGESPDAEALDQNRLKGPREFLVSEESGGQEGEKYDPDIIIPLKFVEESCYEKALRNPEVKYWKLANEPLFHQLKDNLAEMKKYVPIMQSACNGIKRANPDAKVVSPDPANIGVNAGTKWLDTYLEAGGLKTFDIIAAHPYRKNPEEPDLDLDIADFISMLDKHNYQGDIWFTEGGGWPNHILPAYGLDPDDYQGAWAFRAGTLSYDLGYGEKLSSVYLSHFWIVSLKYASRVKMNLAWVDSLTSLDLNMTPRADIWVVNTLGHILGNADYLQDVVISDDIRCYLFEDGKKRPVAVLYNINAGVSRKIKDPPSITLPFAGGEAEIIDLMGNGRMLKERESVLITAFPIFIRGKRGKVDSFREKLGREIEGSDVIRLRPSIRFVGENRAELTLRNIFSSGISGKVTVKCGQETLADKDISLDGRKSITMPITLPPAADPFKPISLRISFLEDGKSSAQVRDLSFVLLASSKRTGPITVDGDLSDLDQGHRLALPDNFKDFPAPSKYSGVPVPWKGKADLSAVLYTAWDEDYFYLALDVKDDVFAPPASLQGAFRHDSLQVYFDGLGDARDRGSFRGYDGNDYNYDFYPLKDGLEAIRAYAPDWQIAFLKTGPALEVKRAFRKVPGGMVYEIAFPLKAITPIALKSGSSFGFALLINDSDNDYRKRGLTITPAGTEPCMSPHLYPVLILK